MAFLSLAKDVQGDMLQQHFVVPRTTLLVGLGKHPPIVSWTRHSPTAPLFLLCARRLAKSTEKLTIVEVGVHAPEHLMLC